MAHLALARLHHGVVEELDHGEGVQRLQVGAVGLVLAGTAVVDVGQQHRLVDELVLVQRILPVPWRVGVSDATQRLRGEKGKKKNTAEKNALCLDESVLDERIVGAEVQQLANHLAQVGVVAGASRRNVRTKAANEEAARTHIGGIRRHPAAGRRPIRGCRP